MKEKKLDGIVSSKKKVSLDRKQEVAQERRLSGKLGGESSKYNKVAERIAELLEDRSKGAAGKV